MADQNVYSTAIEGELTIFAAANLKQQLLAALAEGSEIEIDLSRVTEMDSAGLQLLLAAKREAAARGKPMRLTGHSPAVLAALDLCDLAGHFGDPVLIPRDQQGQS